jgi:hypothetical protein
VISWALVVSWLAIVAAWLVGFEASLAWRMLSAGWGSGSDVG